MFLTWRTSTISNAPLHRVTQACIVYLLELDSGPILAKHAVPILTRLFSLGYLPFRDKILDLLTTALAKFPAHDAIPPEELERVFPGTALLEQWDRPPDVRIELGNVVACPELSRWREMRLNRDLCQVDLAWHMGITRSNLEDIESGFAPVDLAMLTDLSSVLGLAVADLLHGL